MLDDIKTTEEFVVRAENELNLLIKEVRRVKEVADIGLRAMGKLHGIIQDCQSMIGRVHRLKGLTLTAEELYMERRRMVAWLKKTHKRMHRIVTMDKVVKPASVTPAGTLELETVPWYKMLCTRVPIHPGVIVMVVLCTVATIIMSLTQLLA